MTSSQETFVGGHNPPTAQRVFIRRVTSYGVGTTLYKVHVLFLIPLFAHFLAPAENGALEVSLFAAGLLGALVMFNLASVASSRHVASEVSDRPRVLGESAMAISVVAAVAIVLSPALAFGAKFALGELRDDYWLILVSFVGACLNSYVGNTAYLLQLKSARRAFTAIFVSWAILVVSLAAIFIAGYDMGAMGYALAVLMTGIACSTLCVWAVRRELALAAHTNRTIWTAFAKGGRYMRSALPLLPITLFGWVLLLSDRRVLQATTGLDEVGVYGLAIKIASGVSVLLAPIIAAWWDQGMNSTGENVPGHVRRTVDALVIVALAGSIALAVATLLPVDDLIGDDYGEAIRFIPVLGLCSVMTSAFFVPFGLLTRRSRFTAAAVAYGAACVVNLVLTVALTAEFGIGGATVANFAGYLTLICVASWAVRDELSGALGGRGGRYLIATFVAVGVSFAAMA